MRSRIRIRFLIGSPPKSDLKTFLQIPVTSEHQNGITGLELRLRSDGIFNLSVMANTNDINSVLFSDVNLCDTHAGPLVRKIYLKQIMISIQIHKIPDVVGAAADGNHLASCFPGRRLRLRHCAAELGVDIPGSPGDYQSGTQFLQERWFPGNSGNYFRWQRYRHRNCAHPGKKEIFRGAVTNLCAGYEREGFIDPLFIMIDCHDLVSQGVQFHGNIVFQNGQGQSVKWIS